MSDDNIVEHPNALLRRRVDILEVKIQNLEKEREYRIKTELLLLERYEEARGLFLRAMELFKNSNNSSK